MRPSTDGCTEWSCPYHGLFNREKARHYEGCPVRDITRALDPEDLGNCTCDFSSEEDEEL